MKRMWLWLLMVLLCVDAQAAQQQVSGGTGVTWGQERAKVNANFTELYSMYTDAEIDGLLGLKQGADADLNIYAGITPSANVQSLLGAANYGAIRGLLDIEAGTDFNTYDADLTSASGASAAGASKYWGTNASSVAGFYDLPSGGSSLPNGTVVNQILQWNGSVWAATSSVEGLIDDTATNGDADALWSADHTYDLIAIKQDTDADLTTAAGASSAGVSKYFGTNSSSVAGFHDLPSGGSSTIYYGTSALGTSSITPGSCATVVTTTATGVATTDTINWGFNSDPTSTTGYIPSTDGMLTIISYPTAGNVNFKVCNLTNLNITPGAVILNWRIIR